MSASPRKPQIALGITIQILAQRQDSARIQLLMRSGAMVSAEVASTDVFADLMDDTYRIGSDGSESYVVAGVVYLRNASVWSGKHQRFHRNFCVQLEDVVGWTVGDEARVEYRSEFDNEFD